MKPEKRFKMKQIILLVATAVALAACGKEEAPAAKIERPALTHVVGAQAGDAGDVYSGEIRARHESQLAFRIGGKIVERLVDAGAVVKAGQPLARLDATDTALQAGAAEAQYRLAEADAKRYRELRAKGFVSEAALDAKETALKSAAAQAGLAHNQAGYATLRADRDGVVAVTLAEAGQVVGAGQPVLHVAYDGEREVAISIPESQLSGLKPGAPAEITLWAGDGESHFTGRLRELAPAADPVSRTYPARVALDKAGAQPVLGMTARVRFTDAPSTGAERGSGGFVVPLTAIFQQGDRSAVWVVAADRSLSLRPVVIAEYRDDGAVIASGIAAGERIVVAGVHKLSAGEKIRIVESGPK